MRLLETVAASGRLSDALGELYEQLERAYLATAEALGAALESKDLHAAEHARSIVRNSEAVGKRLGMSGDELRDLRYAAAFHDIGKVTVPDTILNKPGPLTEAGARRGGAPPAGRRARSSGRSTSSQASCRSCATATSTGTAAVTPTGSPATGSRSAPG